MTAQPLLATAPAYATYPGLKISVEIAWGANLTDTAGTGWTWSDITHHVLFSDGAGGGGSGVSITLGRADESSDTQTALMTCTLDNRTGDYSDGGMGQYYPYVRRGTPVRVRVSTNNGSTWKLRFQGAANGFTPHWDAETGRWATVELSASGPLRRIEQGTLPLKSAFRRYMENNYQAENVAQYWAMEDPAGSPNFANTIGGAGPGELVTTLWVANDSKSTDAGLWEMGSDETIACSAPLTPFRESDANSQGTIVMPFPGSNIRQISGIYSPKGGEGNAEPNYIWALLKAASGTVYPNAGPSYPVRIRDAFSSAVTLNSWVAGGYWNEQVYRGYARTSWRLGSNDGGVSTQHWRSAEGLGVRTFRWRIAWSGSTWTLGILREGDTAETTHNVSYSSGLTDPQDYDYFVLCPIREQQSGIYTTGGVLGHVCYHTAATSLNASAFYVRGRAGDPPADRITQLCADAEVHLTVLHDAAMGLWLGPTDTMGPQRWKSFSELLREAERTGQGFLFDGLGPGLTYITREYRESKANGPATLTLDAGAGQLMEPFAPIDDDQLTINSCDVTRHEGASKSYTDLTGPRGVNAIGVFSTSIDVNTASDAWLSEYAEWRVHLGTQEGYRYPTVSFALETNPDLIAGWLNCTPQCRVDVRNIAAIRRQHPGEDIRLMLEGWTETIDAFTWRVTANTTRAEAWNVVRLAAATGSTGDGVGRMQTVGSQLNANAAAGATSVSVRTNTGNRWVTTGDDGGSDNFPFDAEVGGCKVRVTNITGTTSPQTFTLAAPGLPRAMTGSTTAGAGTPVKVWRPPVYAM